MKKKLMTFLILFISVFTFNKVNASDVKEVYEYYVNPLYGNAALESYSATGIVEDDAEKIWRVNSVEQAGETLGRRMKERDNIVKITIDGVNYYGEISQDVIDYAFEHTGNPTEGDYLRFQYGGCGIRISYSTDVVTLTYNIKYYTTKEQEEKMDEEIDKVLTSLEVKGSSSLSDYEKINRIYDYIIKNVKYDYEHLGNEDYKLQYTAYAALINKTSVCQGYAVLFYRMALEAGVDARVISGFGNGGRHAWNIVKLGDKYYNLDATWDEDANSSKVGIKWFLLNEASFKDHERDDEYKTSVFNTKYPMSLVNYDRTKPQEDTILSVEIEGNDFSLTKGNTKKLTAKINPSTVTNKKLTWSSSNTNVATVDSNGNVKAVGAGRATITVTTSNGKKDSIEIEVITAVEALKGDLNNDGKVGISDVLLALKLYFKKIEITDYYLKVGDINGKGGIDLSDVLAILKSYFNSKNNI